MAEASTNEVVTKFGVTFTEHATTPVFTTTDAHGLSVEDLISVTAGILGEELSLGTWDEDTNDWVYDSGTEYTIATVPSDTTFTLTGDFNTIDQTEDERKIEYHPLFVAGEKEAAAAEEAEETALAEEAEAGKHTWEQKTLGQNKKIQEIVASAAKASELLNANVEFAKGGIKAA